MFDAGRRRDHDATTTRARTDVAARDAGAEPTAVQTLMRAGGNQAMVQLSRSGAAPVPFAARSAPAGPQAPVQMKEAEGGGEEKPRAKVSVGKDGVSGETRGGRKFAVQGAELEVGTNLIEQEIDPPALRTPIPGLSVKGSVKLTVDTAARVNLGDVGGGSVKATLSLTGGIALVVGGDAAKWILKLSCGPEINLTVDAIVAFDAARNFSFSTSNGAVTSSIKATAEFLNGVAEFPWESPKAELIHFSGLSYKHRTFSWGTFGWGKDMKALFAWLERHKGALKGVLESTPGGSAAVAVAQGVGAGADAIVGTIDAQADRRAYANHQKQTEKAWKDYEGAVKLFGRDSRRGWYDPELEHQFAVHAASAGVFEAKDYQFFLECAQLLQATGWPERERKWQALLPQLSHPLIGEATVTRDERMESYRMEWRRAYYDVWSVVPNAPGNLRVSQSELTAREDAEMKKLEAEWAPLVQQIRETEGKKGSGGDEQDAGARRGG